MHPVRAVFNSFKVPRPGVTVDLVYFAPQPDAPEFWTIRCYRDEFNALSGEDKVVVFNYISDIIKNIKAVEPNVWPEIYETAPRRS